MRTLLFVLIAILFFVSMSDAQRRRRVVSSSRRAPRASSSSSSSSSSRRQPPVKPGTLEAMTAPYDEANQAAFEWIMDHEGGPDREAAVFRKNPRSTAFGVGQLLIATRQRYAALIGANPGSTDLETQMQMTKGYIYERYGTPLRAKAFWLRKRWY